jgi:hypothetical protein
LITSPASTDRDERGEDDQEQEDQNMTAVRLGEARHPQRDLLADLVVAELLLLAHRAQHAPGTRAYALV